MIMYPCLLMTLLLLVKVFMALLSLPLEHVYRRKMIRMHMPIREHVHSFVSAFELLSTNAFNLLSWELFWKKKLLGKYSNAIDMELIGIKGPGSTHPIYFHTEKGNHLILKRLPQ